MDGVNFKDLSRYRLEKAESKINAAELLIKEMIYLCTFRTCRILS